MENLPEIKKDISLALYNPQPGTKAIEIRRQMVQMPEIAKSLNPVEKYVFAASTKTQIADMSDEQLVAKTQQLFKFIAMDIGYIIPTDKTDWAYIQTRLLDILKRYFGQLTLADVKLAFELATTGELDAYLPKDSHGNPDRKHYQQFNADFLSKILNAYKLKQGAVIEKAYKALPRKYPEQTDEQKKYYLNYSIRKNRTIFLRYKYTGILDLELGSGMLCYDWLVKIGFAEPLQATEEDRKKAYMRFMGRVSRGFVNKYEAAHVMKNGSQSPELEYSAYEVARIKEIRRAFDRMVEEEVNIDNYLTFVK